MTGQTPIADFWAAADTYYVGTSCFALLAALVRRRKNLRHNPVNKCIGKGGASGITRPFSARTAALFAREVGFSSPSDTMSRCNTISKRGSRLYLWAASLTRPFLSFASFRGVLFCPHPATGSPFHRDFRKISPSWEPPLCTAGHHAPQSTYCMYHLHQSPESQLNLTRRFFSRLLYTPSRQHTNGTASPSKRLRCQYRTNGVVSGRSPRRYNFVDVDVPGPLGFTVVIKQSNVNVVSCLVVDLIGRGAKSGWGLKQRWGALASTLNRPLGALPPVLSLG